MAIMTDVYHVEDTQAELEKINALVNLLRQTAEDASSEPGPHQSTFQTLNLNLLNVYDLLYQLRAELSKVVDSAYKTR